MKVFLALSLVMASQAAFAKDPCADASTTLDINACAQHELEGADKKLNATYQIVLKQLQQNTKTDPDSGEARKQLIAAQRQWIKFREADCNAIYTLWQSGSIRNLMSLTCMRQRTEQRTRELDDYIPKH